MKEITSRTNDKLSKTMANVKKIIKDDMKNDNLSVFEPELHIRVCPKTR